jgi:hypothetical protein
MKQRFWFIAAIIGILFSVYMVSTHGQTGGALHPYIYGSLVSGGDLHLHSTFHATKGDIFLGSDSTYSEANKRLGIGTTSPAVGLHGVVTNGLFLWSSSEADDTAKVQHLGIEHYDVDDEPFYWVYPSTIANANVLKLGGGYGSGNAATTIGFYTAANHTTTTGTEVVRIDSAGILHITGDAGGPAIRSLQNADTGIRILDNPNDNVQVYTTGAAIADFAVATVSIYGDFLVGPSTGGYFVRYSEMTAPAAAVANTVRVFARDNGGKTELCARFPSGAIQQIAIEP